MDPAFMARERKLRDSCKILVKMASVRSSHVIFTRTILLYTCYTNLLFGSDTGDHSKIF